MVIFATVRGVWVDDDGGVGLIAVIGNLRTNVAMAATVEEEELA